MRGHGIHSPLAYRLVTSVIRGRADYYAYPRLDAIARRDGVSAPRLRLIFRLVCEFAPASVIIDPTLPPAIREAVAAADSRISILTATSCADAGDHPLRILASMPDSLPDRGVIIALQGAPCADPHPRRGHGMLFTDGRMAVAVMRPDLPPQDYDIILPR